jgi:hypothetical protein
MSGSKHTLEFGISGDPAGQLVRIADALSKVARESQKMSEGVEEAGEKLDRVGEATHGSRMQELGKEIMETGAKWREFAHGVVEHAKEIVESFVEVAEEFEDIRSSLDFSFGAHSQEMYAKTLEASQTLAFTFKETADAVANLGKTGVNVFGANSLLTGEITKFKTKTGGMANSLEVLQDTLAGTGLKMSESGRLLRGVHEAMVGNFREFKMGLGMSPHLIEEMKKKMAGSAGDMQKSFEGIIETLGKFYGGATKMKELNLSFQLQLMKDKFEQLKEAIAGNGGIKLITIGLKDFVDALQRLLEDKDAIKGIADAFQMIERAVGWVFHTAAGLIDMGRGLLSAAPWLPKVAMGMVLMTVAGAMLAGSLMTVAGASVLVATSFDAIMLSLAPIALGLEAVVAGGLLLAGVLSLLWIGSKQVGDNVGGVSDRLETLKVLLDALSEAWRTYDGTTSQITVEQGEKLKKAGMEETFLNIWSTVHKAHVAMQEFGAAMEDVGDYLSSVFSPMLDVFGFNVDGKTDSMEKWESMALKVASAFGRIMLAMKVMWDVGSVIFHATETALSTIVSTVYTLVEAVASLVMALDSVLKGDWAAAGKVIKEGVSNIGTAWSVTGSFASQLGTDADILSADDRAGAALQNMDSGVGSSHRQALQSERQRTAMEKWMRGQGTYDEGLGYEGNLEASRNAGILTPEIEASMRGGNLASAPKGSADTGAVYAARDAGRDAFIGAAGGGGTDDTAALRASVVADEQGKANDVQKAMMAAHKEMLADLRQELLTIEKEKVSHVNMSGERVGAVQRDLNMSVAGDH